MQTEPNPLLIHIEPTPDSKDESYRCEICRYKNFYDKWSWYDMYDILQDSLDADHYSHVENTVVLIRKIQCLCNNSLLNSVMTPEIISSIDADEWFMYDYDKVGGYYREDPITKEQIRVPRRREKQVHRDLRRQGELGPGAVDERGLWEDSEEDDGLL